MTAPAPETTAEAVVLDVLTGDIAQRLGGLTVQTLASATDYSTSTVRKALEALEAKNLVKRPYHRSSRGYSYYAVSQAERDAQAAAQALVTDLEEALGQATGTAADVARLINGGVSIRLTGVGAQALLDALKRDLEV